MKLKNKVILNLRQYCMHCYVAIRDVIKLFWVEMYTLAFNYFIVHYPSSTM